MAKLFNTVKHTNAVTKARETADLLIDEESGEHILSVAFCGGKGTGAQQINVSRFNDFVAALSHYAENGVQKAAKPDMNEIDILHSSIGIDDEGMISFRTSSGRGAKPTRISPDQLSNVVAYLRDEVGPNLTEAIAAINSGEAQATTKKKSKKS